MVLDLQGFLIFCHLRDRWTIIFSVSFHKMGDLCPDASMGLDFSAEPFCFRTVFISCRNFISAKLRNVTFPLSSLHFFVPEFCSSFEIVLSIHPRHGRLTLEVLEFCSLISNENDLYSFLYDQIARCLFDT